MISAFPFTTNVAGGSIPQTIFLNLNLSAGNYSLNFETIPSSGLLVNFDSASYPYSSSVTSITGNGSDNTFYLYAYNWKFSNICRSLLTPVKLETTQLNNL